MILNVQQPNRRTIIVSHLSRALTPQYPVYIYDTLPHTDPCTFRIVYRWAFARADGIERVIEASLFNSSIQLRYVALTLSAASSPTSTRGPGPSNKHAGWTKRMVLHRRNDRLTYCVFMFSFIRHKVRYKWPLSRRNAFFARCRAVYFVSSRYNGCHLTPVDEFAHIIFQAC